MSNLPDRLFFYLTLTLHESWCQSVTSARRLLHLIKWRPYLENIWACWVMSSHDIQNCICLWIQTFYQPSGARSRCFVHVAHHCISLRTFGIFWPGAVSVQVRGWSVGWVKVRKANSNFLYLYFLCCGGAQGRGEDRMASERESLSEAGTDNKPETHRLYMHADTVTQPGLYCCWFTVHSSFSKSNRHLVWRRAIAHRRAD